MVIKPIIRNNVMVNSHPLGCEINVKNQIEFIKKQPTFSGPKNVLIIGGSSGYGLASRIALAFGANANTINVSYEAPPKGKRTGTAGYWNNLFFQEEARKDNLLAKDFIGDAFSHDMKQAVIDYIKENDLTIDCLIYSLASGRREDPDTHEIYLSQLRSTTEPIEGASIDFSTGKLFTQTMEVATEDDINYTVKVMGGEDWELWVKSLQKNGLIDETFKTIAYTYIGPEATYGIYRNGTIGKAKEHLEQTAKNMNEWLDGEALISSSKAIITKASAYIPIFPVYGTLLYQVMKEKGTHETTIEHKYRLFKDMVYGDQRLVDEKGILRPDARELESETQAIVNNLLKDITEETLKQGDLEGVIEEFHQINGFMFDLDYDQPINLEELSKKVLI